MKKQCTVFRVSGDSVGIQAEDLSSQILKAGMDTRDARTGPELYALTKI